MLKTHFTQEKITFSILNIYEDIVYYVTSRKKYVYVFGFPFSLQISLFIFLPIIIKTWVFVQFCHIKVRSFNKF